MFLNRHCSVLLILALACQATFAKADTSSDLAPVIEKKLHSITEKRSLIERKRRELDNLSRYLKEAQDDRFKHGAYTALAGMGALVTAVLTYKVFKYAAKIGSMTDEFDVALGAGFFLGLGSLSLTGKAMLQWNEASYSAKQVRLLLRDIDEIRRDMTALENQLRLDEELLLKVQGTLVEKP